MRFLFVAKQKKVAEAFVETLRALIDRGHSVTLAVQEHDEKRSERFEAAIGHPRFTVVPCPEVRSDDWADVASLLRRLRDCVHYLRPPLRGAVKLRARVLNRLRQDLQFEGDLESLADALLTIPPDHAARIDRILSLAEQRLPPDPRFNLFLEQHAPDVLLLSPVVHFGPAQSDLIASARHRGIPAWMLLYSWDNLSTKGALHRWPDRMFVWNEHQQREAELLHGFPADRVIVVGAPRFDEFFALRPAMRQDEFLAPLGLDPAKPTLLYVCSSRFVSESELPFVRRWISALRQSASQRLQTCNIVVRPHPDIALLSTGTSFAKHQWPTAPDLVARVARPFADARAIVLVTPNDRPRGLFESIIHSEAIVGLNTTAELEAGIAGRPVFTILADEREADGQQTTVHFHYLLRENGGFVSTAANFDEHVVQLDGALARPEDRASIRAFIESFVRPHGFDTPVSPLFADALQATATNAYTAFETGGVSPAPEDAELRDIVQVKSARSVLPLGESRLGLSVYAAPIANRRACNDAVPLHADVVDWIERDIAIGDVVYDVGSGIGEYALVMAKHKGATVIAFEPAYAAHAEFCDNILLNHCEAFIVPVPLALAGRDGLAEIKYLQDRPGEPGYLVRSDIDWRVKHRGRNKPYLQPACLVSLDSFVQGQRPPSPHHIRLAPDCDLAAILAGAGRTFRLPSLKTLWLQVSESTAAATLEVLAQSGWIPRTRFACGEDVQFVFVRQGSPAATVGS
jgi:FkbM family methyltransferase